MGSRASGVYVDANADTVVCEAALVAYRQAAADAWANPAAAHALGQQAAAHLAASRARVSAAVTGGAGATVIFVSGGTEAAAFVVLGILARCPGAHAICSAIEHPAVACAFDLAQQRFGIQVTRLPVGRQGQIDVAALAGLLRDDTRLVSVLAASNETGVVQPVQAVAALCRPRGVLVHTDAVQAVGRLPLTPLAAAADALTLSGHKFGALAGTGAVIMPAGASVLGYEPLLAGGGQQEGLRAGTDDVAGAAALAAALDEAVRGQARHSERAARVRGTFERAVCESVAGVEIIGHGFERLCNTTALRVEGCQAEGLLMALDQSGIAVSTGSACASGAIEPSPALLAMGYGRREALQVLRFSWPPGAEVGDVERTVTTLARAVTRMRLG